MVHFSLHNGMTLVGQGARTMGWHWLARGPRQWMTLVGQVTRTMGIVLP